MTLEAQTVRRQDGLLIMLCLATLFGFATIILPLPVLPLFVHQKLGFGAAVAGTVIGVQFLATFFTRGQAGAMCDRIGARRVTLTGFGLCMVSGAVLIAAALMPLPRLGTVAVLMLARLVMGLGESQIVIGVLAWGIGTVGPAQSGKVMSWVGLVIYAALAGGAPFALAIDGRFGLVGVGVSVMILPLAAIACCWAVPAVPINAGRRASMASVIARVWRPGVALALQGIGIAAISAFVVLYFAARGWPGAGLALTAFGICFALMRAVGGHLPDKLGGPRVAMAAMALETVGLLLLAMAPTALLALIGAGITGLGVSLNYPSLGLVVVAQVEPSVRSTALGTYTAFQDIAYGLTGPVAGLLAERLGYPAAFVLAAAGALAGLALTATMLRKGRTGPAAA